MAPNSQSQHRAPVQAEAQSSKCRRLSPRKWPPKSGCCLHSPLDSSLALFFPLSPYKPSTHLFGSLLLAFAFALSTGKAASFSFCALEPQNSKKNMCLNAGQVQEDEVVDSKILPYCSISKKAEKRSIGEMEQDFLQALQSFYYDNEAIMSNEEFDNLKEELMWEGSSVVMLSSDEQRFLEASMAYVSGNPIVSDKEFDALKLRLKLITLSSSNLASLCCSGGSSACCVVALQPSHAFSLFTNKAAALYKKDRVVVSEAESQIAKDILKLADIFALLGDNSLDMDILIGKIIVVDYAPLIILFSIEDVGQDTFSTPNQSLGPNVFSFEISQGFLQVYSDLTVDYFKMFLLNVPAAVIALTLFFFLDDLTGFEITYLLELPEPFSFIFTWFAALPLIFWLAQSITNFIVKDFLILKGPCPNCGVENVSFFGTILSIPSGGVENTVKCSNCGTAMLYDSRLRLITLPEPSKA
ncbi:hypothetical protein M5K25_007510 [Dendrobium thyrsiflorum]|uniref:PGR5-like protein 1A, chloroplastic n=1 Tax=Dendrobium thyrsiflorum TaxID=117978 RepID=A0ABD0VFD6_DENTH